MRLVVNGNDCESPEGGTLGELIEALGIVKGAVAVVLNDEIVPASARGSRRLQEGDRVEMFRFVGGG
jgi:sulfur carrier protein